MIANRVGRGLADPATAALARRAARGDDPRQAQNSQRSHQLSHSVFLTDSRYSPRAAFLDARHHSVGEQGVPPGVARLARQGPESGGIHATLRPGEPERAGHGVANVTATAHRSDGARQNVS
jgi:hypothetical protein